MFRASGVSETFRGLDLKIERPLSIRVHGDDNVEIVANEGGLPVGAQVSSGISLLEHIPQGHKVAVEHIPEGAKVRRYNCVIGIATKDLPMGSWVNETNLAIPSPPNLENLPISTKCEPVKSSLEERSFMGYRNADGTVGTRNLLGITTTVQCVSGVVDFAARRIREELLPCYHNVDGVVALEHSYGCGVAIDALNAEIPIRTLRNISRNPNFGGELMVVSLGCEKLQPARLFPAENFTQSDLLRLQDQENDGFGANVAALMKMAESHLERLNARKREPCPVSDLVVGLQCGGSDALSGVTANPALGHASDMIVAAGGTVMFSENSEVRDGIDQLTARAKSPEVAGQLIEELTWFDDYLALGGVDRAANTTPGNKAGGLSNIVEKAMGSIIKSGTAPISGVVPPGKRADQTGLLFAATPASDFICGTLQLAAGATLHVFSTGRGTPYSLEALPVLKVSTRSELSRRWHDLIDFDAGQIATGQMSVSDAGELLFEQILAVASGQKTWAERHGIRNSLALFNPAPVT